MIDAKIERAIPLAEAAKLKWFPKALHYTTLLRWCKVGRRGIQLESISIGETLCTSEEAVMRFFERLTVSRVGGATPVNATKAFKLAEAALDAAGIK